MTPSPPNPPPIVLVASGASRAGPEAYQALAAICRSRFPAHPLHWVFATRGVRGGREQEGHDLPPSPAEAFAALQASGRVPVVQALLLLCGLEFHDMVRSVRRFWPGAPIGLPLLSGDGDVAALTEALAPVVERAGEEALLWVGHGTGHPSGLAYQALTAVWRRRFGPRVALGLLSGGPTPREIAAGFRAAGMQRVRLRPLMLLAGTHFWRDMAGDGPDSWKSRLQIEGLEVDCDPQALMESPGVAAIFGDHLQAALDRHPGNP